MPIHMSIHVYIYTYTDAYTYVYTCVYRYIYTYCYTYMYIYICIYIYVYIYICIYIYTRTNESLCMYIYIVISPLNDPQKQMDPIQSQGKHGHYIYTIRGDMGSRVSGCLKVFGVIFHVKSS